MSFAEYFVESFFFPSWKSWHLVSYVGFLMLVSGQVTKCRAWVASLYRDPI